MTQVMTPSETQLHHTLYIAGFGGQGVLTLGQTLVAAALHEGREVIWTPAYGPEMRGGPSFCTVIISSDPIGAPVVDRPHTAVIMDQPSLAKYQGRVRSGGLILLNTSLVTPRDLCADVTYYGIKANALAEEIGEPRTANMVMLGALVALTKLAAPASIIEALKKSLPVRRHNLLPINERALLLGAQELEIIQSASLT